MSEEKIAAKRRCPLCSELYAPGLSTCDKDGTLLVPVKEDPLLGKIFEGKYRVVSEVGRGGMSVVYRAVHELMRRDVAIKLLQQRELDDPNAVMRFQREAMAASCLEHANITSVYDFGVAENGSAYLVMDFIDGKPLDELLKESGPLPYRRAIKLMLQVVDALAHAHNKGVIHRDLKPSNIVCLPVQGDSERVKVVDFGIAKLLDSSGKQAMQLTSTNEIFGTPVYMSPEQIESQLLDCRSDIYSAGAVLYELLAGVPPFQGRTANETMSFHINRDPLPISQVKGATSIPPALDRLVLKTLAKKPDDRLQSMDEFRSQLEAILSGGGAASSNAHAPLLSLSTLGWATAFCSLVVLFYVLYSGKLTLDFIGRTSPKIGTVDGVIYYLGQGKNGPEVIVHSADGVNTQIGLGTTDLRRLADSPRYASNGALWHIAYSDNHGVNQVIAEKSRSDNRFDADVRDADQTIRDHYANMGRKRFQSVYNDFSPQWEGLKELKNYIKDWSNLKIIPGCENAPPSAIRVIDQSDNRVTLSVDMSQFVSGETKRYTFVCIRDGEHWRLLSAKQERD